MKTHRSNTSSASDASTRVEVPFLNKINYGSLRRLQKLKTRTKVFMFIEVLIGIVFTKLIFDTSNKTRFIKEQTIEPNILSQIATGLNCFNLLILIGFGMLDFLGIQFMGVMLFLTIFGQSSCFAFLSETADSAITEDKQWINILMYCNCANGSLVIIGMIVLLRGRIRLDKRCESS